MNHRIAITFKEMLNSQLAYFEENLTTLMYSFSELADRNQMRELLNRYCHEIKLYLDGHSDEGPNSLVWIGSCVKITNVIDQVDEEYTIVMPADVNPYVGRISFMSPMGQRLLLSPIGYTVEIDSPVEKYWITVKGLTYGEKIE